MLDDDIEYLGTRPAQRILSNNPFLQTTQIVTGITLCIEKSSDESAYDLTFRRANTSVIHIGRRPATEAGKDQGNNQRAMFRCAVVSRKHAKIAFSDSGHVYLIDMNSHHGTHILKPGELVSRMLKPETPTQLAHGDVLTFGKSVGRNDECVRPVIARVELIHGPRSDNVFKPVTPLKHGFHFDFTKSPSRSTSGRYGVYVPTSPSDSPSSPVSQGSDIEEIPASGPNALPLQPRGVRTTESESHIGRAFEALKKLLPPIDVPGETPERGSSHNEDSGSSSPHRPPSPLSFGNAHFSPIYSPLWSPSFRSDSPDDDRSPSPFPQVHQYWNNFHPSVGPRSYSHSPSEGNKHHLAPGSGLVNHSSFDKHRSEGRSRSMSPMDLASPSPPLPPGLNLNPGQSSAEPSIIGAWPDTRPFSLHASTSPEPPVVAVDIDVPAEPSSSTIPKAMSLNSICDSEPPAQQVTVSESPEKVLATPVVTDVLEAQPVKISDTMSTEIGGLQASLTKLQSDVNKLQVHRRKYKTRFNTNVHVISDKLTDLDERVTDVNALYNTLLERVDGATDIDIPDLQAQVEHLKEQLDALPTISGDTTSEPMLHERKDVQESIETLRELVIEMRTLRETTQQHMAAELAAVRAARDAALAAITAHVGVQTHVTPVQPSLKRKRSDEMDEIENASQDARDPESSVIDTSADAGVSDVANVTMADAATPITFTTIGVPPQKRARRIAAVAVQTATAVTVGAIATWSALAFS